MEKPGRKKRILIIGAAVLLVIAAGTVLLVNIRDITVTGNQQYSDDQIRKLLFSGKWERNSAYCFFGEQFKRHRQIPFVEDYEIEFKSPLSVEVIVYEKSIVGYVSYMGSYMYFDKDGIVVESASEELEGIPLITGLKFGHIVLHEPIPVEDERIFGQILNLTQMLTTNHLKVDKIEYDSQGKAVLTIGEIDVILGDNTQMSGKIAKLRDLAPLLAGRAGILYLDTYDETNPKKSYRFMPERDGE